MALARLTDEMWHAVCEDALDDYGYLLIIGASAGQVKKADGSAKVVGVAFKSTVNPITGDAEADKEVAIVRHGQARVKFGTSHAAIAVGDTICAMAGGLGQKQTVTSDMTWAERIIRVGTALSALALNTAGYVIVDLNLPE